MRPLSIGHAYGPPGRRTNHQAAQFAPGVIALWVALTTLPCLCKCELHQFLLVFLIVGNGESRGFIGKIFTKYKRISRTQFKGGFTLRFGPTDQTETSSATVWNDCTTSPAVWGPSTDSSSLEVQLHLRFCLYV